ncbi:hypothetical protein [Streptomyces sp. AD55]|uniref:hypothetical protein n=1 Tax=Streptomyces sp. AD55 TaxID=3242895 RepID=UPI003529C03B
MTTPVRQRDDRAALAALVTAATAELVRQWQRLTTAQDALLRALERLRPGRGATTSIRPLVTRFHHEVGEFDRQARALAERWAGQDLPVAYRDGAVQALRRAGAGVSRFRWTTDHQAAITGITAGFYADLMGRVQEAVRRAQAFARAAGDSTREVTMGHVERLDTPGLAVQHPLSMIVYRDDSRHPVQAWATAALTYQGVLTANRGALNTGVWDLGAEWFECVDGPHCGFTSHPDTDHASGTIRSAEDAEMYPLAHFGCIRRWIPRPDLNGRRGLVSGDQI